MPPPSLHSLILVRRSLHRPIGSALQRPQSSFPCAVSMIHPFVPGAPHSLIWVVARDVLDHVLQFRLLSHSLLLSCSVVVSFAAATLFCRCRVHCYYLAKLLKSLSFLFPDFLFPAGVFFLSPISSKKAIHQNFCCLNHGRQALPHAGQEAAVSSGTCRAYPRCVLSVMWKKLLAAMLVTRAA